MGMSDREAFEQWAEFELMAHDFGRGEHGEYLDDFLQQSWLGWQAAREQEGGEAVAIGRIESINPMDFTGVFKWKPAINGNIPKSLEINAKLYTHPPQSQGVPEEYRQALQDACDIIQADANTEENYGSLCRIGSVLSRLSTPAAPQADEIEPDLLWDYDNGEDSGQDSAYELADYCASDLPHGETMEVVVMCAKRLPNRHMKIWVDEDDDVQWEWISPQPPEQGDGV